MEFEDEFDESGLPRFLMAHPLLEQLEAQNYDEPTIDIRTLELPIPPVSTKFLPKLHIFKGDLHTFIQLIRHPSACLQTTLHVVNLSTTGSEAPGEDANLVKLLRLLL